MPVNEFVESNLYIRIEVLQNKKTFEGKGPL
jgi:hypothetical protein